MFLPWRTRISDKALFVPVRDAGFGLSLRLFRTAGGERTAVAFTSPVRLATVLGTGQKWVRLGEPALRRLIEDLDVAGVVTDPAGVMTREAGRAA
ncbi:hypothetical protein J5X84_22605 [Streptosporangiaceae bacterium NEAU-GS5]|nr:hypothetical protein [Streptosporangiaceae bacterium NEAU-GS5]